ncbi:hypothetical protein NST50_07210 [Paenibacillus sp. FSL E2-0202]
MNRTTSRAKRLFPDYGKTVSFIAEVPSVSRLFLAGLSLFMAEK